MPTNNERTANNAFVYRFRNGNFSNVITYMKNVISEIQQDCRNRELTDEQVNKILSFGNNPTESDFIRFVNYTECLGYSFYKLTEIR